MSIGGEMVRVFLFVATLGYSRRGYVAAFRHERQGAWFDGLEGAFRHFGGVPAEVLIDNARALVDHHDAITREVRFNERFHAFARYWGSGHAGSEVARHPLRRGRRELAVEAAHLAGIVADVATGAAGCVATAPVVAVASELLRPLSEYEGVIGGGW